MPNGVKQYIGASKRGNTRQRRTDYTLNDRPGPARIPRMLFTNNQGMLDTGDSNTFPPFNSIPSKSSSGIPGPGHTRIVKIIYRPPSTTLNVISDETIQIDAFSAASPLV